MTKATTSSLPADFVFAAAEADRYVRQFLATAAHYVLNPQAVSCGASMTEAVVRIHPEK